MQLNLNTTCRSLKDGIKHTQNKSYFCKAKTNLLTDQNNKRPHTSLRSLQF